jgi:hypothetical protein
MAVVAVRRNAFIPFFRGSLEANNNSLLPDVEVTEATDQAHAVQLACLFFESADKQHFPVEMQQVFFGNVGCFRGLLCSHGQILAAERDSSTLNHLYNNGKRWARAKRVAATAARFIALWRPAGDPVRLMEDWRWSDV